MKEALQAPIPQSRIGDIITMVDRIIDNSLVVRALHSPGITTGIGWGGVEYRYGDSMLCDKPLDETDTPAEIAYYPVVPEIDVKGAIYWHGEKSNALKLGRLAGFYFDDRLEDGNHIGYLQIRLEDGELRIGDPEPGRHGKLLPPTQENLHIAEASLLKLLDYLEAQDTLFPKS